MLFSAPDHFNMTGGSDRRLRVASAAFPGIGTSLLSVISSGHEIDLADDDFLTIMLPTRGVTQVRVDRKGHVVREGEVLALGPSERWTQVDRRGHRNFRANVVKVALEGGAHGERMVPDMAGDPVVPIAPAALEGFRGLLGYLFADLASPVPTLVHQPASDLFAALVGEHLRHLLTAEVTGPARERAPQDLVRRARDYMAAFAAEPLTVPTIAAALGVSPRRLQDAFRATGQTPWEHLTAIRLTKARARLLSGAGGSVTATALDCGFSHLGRFAQCYRRKYNEAPSATLARATDQSRKPF